jgi:hypothetical protein
VAWGTYGAGIDRIGGVGMSSEYEDDEWEICDLWHDVTNGVGKHKNRLVIHKEMKHRSAFCRTCGKTVDFERVININPIGLILSESEEKMNENKGKYHILWFYGKYEGWSFDDNEFDSAEKALSYAMNQRFAKFKIVKNIIFDGTYNEND